MFVQYQIQEYGGRRFKNEKTMTNALAKDDNWYGSYIQEGTREMALFDLKSDQDYYENFGRFFRVRIREIQSWEVVS